MQNFMFLIAVDDDHDDVSALFSFFPENSKGQRSKFPHENLETSFSAKK